MTTDEEAAMLAEALAYCGVQRNTLTHIPGASDVVIAAATLRLLKDALADAQRRLGEIVAMSRIAQEMIG